MVFFTCNTCGESVKKAQVEKHYSFQCRNCDVLSCVDCGKDFHGDEYKSHNSCITEEEKYSGPNYKPKPSQNKGAAKQEQWMDRVQAALSQASAPPRLRPLLQQMQEYSNVPRKQKKFENFIANSLRIRDKRLVSELWDFMAPAFAPQPANQTNETEATANGEEAKKEEEGDKENGVEEERKLSKREKKEERSKKTTKKQKKDKTEKAETKDEEDQEEGERKTKKKRKKEKHQEVEKREERPAGNKRKRRDDTEDDVSLKKQKREEKEEEDQDAEEEEEKKTGRFSWCGTMTSVLEAAGGELAVKRLRKKVLAAFLESGNMKGIKTEEKMWATFDAKLRKNSSIKVFKDKAKLSTTV